MIADPEFAPFSHATLDPVGRAELRAKLIVASAQVQTAIFLRRHGAEVARASSGLTDVLSRWNQCGGTIDQAMLLPLAIRTIRDSKLDPVRIAALSASHLNWSGHEGEWRATLAEPSRIRFGIRQTPPIREIAVSASGGRVEVSLDGRPAIEIGQLKPDVPVLHFNQSWVPILGRETQPTLPVDDSAELASLSLPEVNQCLSEAHSILSRSAPDYLKWVEDAVSAVVPIVPPGENVLQSFSLPGVNGVIFVSLPSPPLKVAELLVHECSHQYFHYGLLDTLFSNGMDTALYWSPYVQKDRPIDRILVAFHAFANIVLFYRACLAAGTDDFSETAEMEIESNLQHLAPMSEYLDRSRGLSPTGRGLFEPLRDELFR
jgi:hypothetical protein